MQNLNPMRVAIKRSVGSTNNHILLEEFESRFGLGDANTADLLIEDNVGGIKLTWQVTDKKPLQFFIDVEKFAAQQKTFPAPKQAGLNQALGKKSKTIIDATTGWAGDALLLCAQGYQLTLIERNPVIALMLRDAMARLANTTWAEQHEVIVPQLIEGDAAELLARGELRADCIYCDPMFPPKKKKSAAVNKFMQLLQALVGADHDAAELVKIASANYSRVVVKRPNYAEPLLRQPDTRFSTKLVHYDVYLSN